MTKEYPRDLVGYGANPPDPRWPGRARVALQFVVNYEEGGENCVLHGDSGSEQFLSEIVGAESYTDRHLSMESIYEYGSRAGFWRLHRLFTQQQIPVTVFGVATALEKHPDAVQAMLEAEWEIACHGLRWIHYQHFTEAQEREHIEQAIAIHERVTGSKPKGWYTGRTSPHTLKLIAQRDDILYCADSYADDLPYWDNNYSKPLLMVPYTLDSNDMRFATPQGFNSGEQFFQYLKDAFDELYQEGADSPKMLSIGLHCRLVGRPGRLAGLRRFIEYTRQFDDVWYATREQIAKHWLANEPDKHDNLKTQAHNVADISACNTEQYYGLLDGIKVSVKDLFDVKGFKTGAGLPTWLATAQAAQKHARAVSLLVEDGAYLDHKTQLDELAYSLAGSNAHYGVSRNPLDEKCVSGGSSSGAAVSVALGDSDIGLATDTGGSIRVPGSYCGLYGLRPTFGRVPVDGLVPLAPRFDTAGLLTRDLKLLETACHALFADSKPEQTGEPIDTLLWCDALWQGVDASLKAYAWRCYRNYGGSKREIGEAVLDADQRGNCFAQLQAQSIWQTHGDWLQSHIHAFGEDIQTRLRWGLSLLSSEQGAEEIAQAEADYQRWSEAKNLWLPRGAALLMPTAPSIAPLIKSSEDPALQRNTLLGLTSIAGLSGWPQLQIPVTFDGELPRGLSLLGRENSDIALMRLAQRVLGCTD
jgi:putative urate catabolism protein